MQDFGRFDYIIVGAGSAGCVLANRLSADPAIKVLLIEAGGTDDYIWIKIPIGFVNCIGNPRTDWCFKGIPEPGLGGRALPFPRGRVLGGTSSINGMVYIRGQAADYDHWRQLGNVGWAWDDVLPYFLKSEDFAGEASDVHGKDGGLRIERPEQPWPVVTAFEHACAQTGISPTDDFNRGDNTGVGHYDATQRRGTRWSAARGYLTPIRKRQNLRIVTNALVDRVRLYDRRAVGVALRIDGQPARADAAGEIILAAGAIGSPHLLHLSGIGAPETLAPVGIDVVHALPAVGENLQDHLQLRAIYRVANTKTLNNDLRSWIGKAGAGLRYALFRDGPLAMPPSQVGAFAHSDPSVATPDLQFHLQPLSLDRFGEPLHPFPGITVSVCNLRPEARGHVRPRTSNIADEPEIFGNYLANDNDEQVAIAALKLTRRIMTAEALARYTPEELLPGPGIADDAGLLEAARAIATSMHHHAGTCHMGQAADAVVGPDLKVHGIDGLRVADASIMPTVVSGNTHAPTVMIAEKASDMIRQTRGRC